MAPFIAPKKRSVGESTVAYDQRNEILNERSNSQKSFEIENISQQPQTTHSTENTQQDSSIEIEPIEKRNDDVGKNNCLSRSDYNISRIMKKPSEYDIGNCGKTIKPQLRATLKTIENEPFHTKNRGIKKTKKYNSTAKKQLKTNVDNTTTQTFSENPSFSQNSNIIPCSQTSNYETFFRELVMSQPPRSMAHKQKMLWLQERRQVGTWVECSRPSCRKWRYLPHVHDPLQVPEKWFCEMNTDEAANSCSKPEHVLNLSEEEDLIHATYTAGSLVWASLPGHPTWPAMVDDCPDTEQYYWLDGFSDIPTWYNVTFFDSLNATRAWIPSHNLKPLFARGQIISLNNAAVPAKYKYRIEIAKKQAKDAATLSIFNRLRKYSFVSRFDGSINKPTSKKLLKINPRDYAGSSSESSDSSSDSDEESPNTQSQNVSNINCNKSTIPSPDSSVEKMPREMDKSKQQLHSHVAKSKKSSVAQSSDSSSNEEVMPQEIYKPKQQLNSCAVDIEKMSAAQSSDSTQEINIFKKHKQNSVGNYSKMSTLSNNSREMGNIHSEMTIVPSSYAIIWKDRNNSTLLHKSLSVTSMSEVIPLQSQIVYSKANVVPLLSREMSNKSHNSRTSSIHSNSFLNMSSAVSRENTETQNIAVVEEDDTEQGEETESSIFLKLCGSDAVVPSTEDDVANLNFDNSATLSQKSLHFDMY